MFISDNFPPEVNAPATRTFEHCREWVQNGANVTVVTCAPNFPTGKVFNGYSNKLLTREWIDGIQVIRVWSYISANEGFIKRIMDYVSFSIMAVLFSLRLKFDIVVATSPQFFTAIAGRSLSVLKGKPWIMEVRDLWPESIIAVGALQNKTIIHFLEWLEIKCYSTATRIISVTDSFKKTIVRKGINSRKISVITNGANLDMFNPQEKDQTFIKKQNLEGKFVLAYIGTLGMAHGLDFIVDSAKQISDDTIHILLIGEGANKENLLNVIENKNIKNVSILDAVPKDQIKTYIASIDVALVNLKKLSLFKGVIPSKIFENAAMGKPILLGVNGESRQIIEKYNSGLYFEPENTDDFLDKLYNLKNNNALYQKCQIGGHKLAHDFDRKKLALKMLNVIQKEFTHYP